MRSIDHRAHPRAAVREENSSLFVALELSKSVWLIAVSAPGSEKVSKYRVGAADVSALVALLARLEAQAERYRRGPVQVVSIHEAGLDGFWVHRMLQANGVESHVVDAASIAVDRRSRRAKTDRIDAERLLRTLMGWARGERRICSMVRPPSPADEDERRLSRERGTLVTERTRHVNRIKGLLATQGVFGFEPLHKNRRKRLEELQQRNGQPLPPRLMAELLRELDRLEVVMSQLAALEAERDRALQARRTAFRNTTKATSSGTASVGEVGSQLLRTGDCLGAVAGSVLSQLQQPAGSGCLFWPRAKPLEERWHRRRARYLEGGQRALANHHDSACLVVGASSARQCSEPMVPRKGRRQARQDQAHRHCSCGAQVISHALAVCDARRGTGGSRTQGVSRRTD